MNKKMLCISQYLYLECFVCVCVCIYIYTYTKYYISIIHKSIASIFIADINQFFK